MKRRTRVMALAMLVGLTRARGAAAQDDTAHLTWEQLVQRAQDASRAGNHQEAVAWAQKAATIRVSPSLRVFLVGEDQAVGDLAGAYRNASLCVSEAEGDAQLPMRDRILAACHQAVAATEPAIGRLAVTLPAVLPPGATVVVNGQTLAPAVLVLPYPVNPGSATVDVAAPGFVPFHVSVTVGSSTVTAVDVTLQPEAVACPAGQAVGPDAKTCVPVLSEGPAPPSGAPATAPVAPAASAAPEVTPRTHKMIPLVVATVGAVVAAGGTVAWFVSNGKYLSLKTDCTSVAGCTRSDWESRSSTIKTLDALSYLGWGVGGAALVGGALWYFASGPATAPTSALNTGGSHRGDVHWADLQWGVDPIARRMTVCGEF